MCRASLAALADEQREKHLLREAVRPYISDAVYARTKKPFWAPPRAASGLNPLNELVQDTLRSDGMDAVPFFDRREVQRLLDTLPGLDPKAYASVDSLLLVLTSLCVMQERFRL